MKNRVVDADGRVGACEGEAVVQAVDFGQLHFVEGDPGDWVQWQGGFVDQAHPLFFPTEIRARINPTERVKHLHSLLMQALISLD